MRILIALLLVVAALACGSEPEFGAGEAIDAFVAAGLEAPNPRDVTATECTGDTACEEAVATDVVTVFRWRDAVSAHRHSTGLQQPAYAVGEFVIAFPVGTDAPTNQYADALAEAVGTDGQ